MTQILSHEVANDAADKRLKTMLLTSDLPGEEWMTILVPADCRDWSISNHGRVRNRITGRIIRPTKDTNGRLMVRLGRQAQGVQVKALMARHWMGSKPEGHVAVYKSTDVIDNSLTNLTWMSKAELAARVKAARALQPPTTLAERIIREYKRTGNISATARNVDANYTYVKAVLKRAAKLKAVIV